MTDTNIIANSITPSVDMPAAIESMQEACDICRPEEKNDPQKLLVANIIDVVPLQFIGAYLTRDSLLEGLRRFAQVYASLEKEPVDLKSLEFDGLLQFLQSFCVSVEIKEVQIDGEAVHFESDAMKEPVVWVRTRAGLRPLGKGVRRSRKS